MTNISNINEFDLRVARKNFFCKDKKKAKDKNGKKKISKKKNKSIEKRRVTPVERDDFMTHPGYNSEADGFAHYN